MHSTGSVVPCIKVVTRSWRIATAFGVCYCRSPPTVCRIKDVTSGACGAVRAVCTVRVT